MSQADIGRVLTAGTYRVEGFAVPFSVTLPDGWTPDEFTQNHIQLGNTANDGLYNISLLVVDKVFADPCTAAGGPQPMGSGVDDLVAALSTMAGFEVDGLRDASVGGAAGKAFTLTNAVDTEAENCVGGAPWLWIGTYEKDGSDELVRTIGGAVDPMWVVDVAGKTVLIAPGVRDVSPSSLAAAEGMLDSISFAIAAGATPSATASQTRIALVGGCDVAGDIYTMNADGSDLVNLTNSSAHDSEPAWSPDRTRIAFVSLVRHNSDIYVMNADGSDVVQVTESATDDGSPAWSPDGTRIALARVSAGIGPRGIFTMNADGSNMLQLTHNGGAPAWSPDGTKIAFVRTEDDGNREIYTMNAGGFIHSNLNITNSVESEERPAWSPDGTRIAFVRGGGIHWSIYTMNADGSDVRRLTDGSMAVSPAWSPDGTRIAFQKSVGIYAMNADGSDPVRVLISTPVGCAVSPSW